MESVYVAKALDKGKTVEKYLVYFDISSMPIWHFGAIIGVFQVCCQ